MDITSIWGLGATYGLYCTHVGGHIWLCHCPQTGANAIFPALGMSYDPVLLYDLFQIVQGGVLSGYNIDLGSRGHIWV